MRKRFALALLLPLLSLTVASAQYFNRPDPKTPRLPNGKPNMTAPAPRTANGKIDLGGLWHNPDGRFLTNLSRRAGITPPFTPWAAALFKERQDNAGRDRPAGRCLPHSIPNAMLVPDYPWKLVQTPEEVVVLYENFTQYRQIFTDGRSVPAQLEPTWFGVQRSEGLYAAVDRHRADGGDARHGHHREYLRERKGRRSHLRQVTG